MVSKDLKDFIKSTKNKHFASDKVDRYKKEVFELRSSDFSYQKICSWLKGKSVEVSTKTIERYMNNHKKEYNDFLEEEKEKR